jgi:hypothetical protein
MSHNQHELESFHSNEVAALQDAKLQLTQHKISPSSIIKAARPIKTNKL